MGFTHIIGPPGTGKTQTLMGIIEDLLNRGIEPQRICFCSFTKAAVREAQDRVFKTFGIPRGQLPYFGTIHSICFRHLGLKQSQVLIGKNWREFCQYYKIPFSETGVGRFDLDEPWEPAGNEEGEILKAWYDWTRNNCLPLERGVKLYPGGVDYPGRALWFAARVEEYKKEKRLVDFVDMLLLVEQEGWAPDIDALILDEAQDLSPLQQRIFMQWTHKAKYTFLGYDEDQAIYSFQGADPRWLMDLPGERRFLEQSHRVPRKPALLAQRIIERNKNRYSKTWLPRKEEGEVYFDVYLGDLLPRIADDASEKTWFLLARNNIYLQNYSRVLMQQGIPYANLRGASPILDIPISVLTALKLARGIAVTPDELYYLAKDTPSNPYWERGAKKRIEKLFPDEEITLQKLFILGARQELIDLLGDIKTCLRPIKAEEGRKEYYLRVFNRYGYEGLRKKPRITLGSFHSVKGQQADNVVLLPNVTSKTHDSYAVDPEPERRVWYVAITRSRENLYLLAPLGRGRTFQEW